MRQADLRRGVVYANGVRHWRRWTTPPRRAVLLSAAPHHVDDQGRLRPGRETSGRGPSRYPMAVENASDSGSVWEPKLVCSAYIVCEWSEFESEAIAAAVLAEADAVLADQLERERAELEQGMVRAGLRPVTRCRDGDEEPGLRGDSPEIEFEWDDLVRLIRRPVDYQPNETARILVPQLLALELFRHQQSA